MNRSARRIFLWWLLAMLAGAAVAWNGRFSADISFFLPARPTAAQQILVDQIQEGAVSRLLMLAIEGGEAAQRADLSRDLRRRLAALPEFLSVQNGDAGSQDSERDFLLAHRYLLSPAVTPERFTVPGLHAAIADSIDLLTSPAGLLLKPYLTRDPTGELTELLGRLGGGTAPNSVDGVWAARDGRRALLLVQTRALGSDTDGQERAIVQIRRQFAAASRDAGLSGVELRLAGAGLFAVESRATIKREVTRLSLISLSAIVALLSLVYRSPRVLLLSLLPVASGALAGVVAVSLAYGTVYGITVGFGSALIGEAVDYAIYYFVQSGRLGLDGWRQRLWPTVRLGMLTSVFGFAALLFSSFPGLAQLGLYSLAGVLTAALVTRFVLPPLAGPPIQIAVPARIGAALAAGLHRARILRAPAVVLALAAAATLAVRHDRLWLPELAALSTISAQDAALDARLRSELGVADTRYLVVVTAPTREAALQAAERAGRRLDRLVADGEIGGYESPARVLPSEAAQAARRASLPSAEDLRPRLQAALDGLPLSIGKLAPFVADLEAARRQPLLERHDLDGSALALAVDSLLLHGPDGWHALLPLRPAGEPAGADIPVAMVRAALAGGGALLIDTQGQFDALYGDYLRQAVRLSSAGLLAIVALLAVALRSARRLVGVLLPLLLAVAMVTAALHLAGERLHLLHLVGLLLIVAVGSNYALFFDRIAAGAPLDTATLTSMAVAATTTVIGFGTLALSSVPVLHAIGVTVGPGAVLALLMSAIFAPVRSEP